MKHLRERWPEEVRLLVGEQRCSFCGSTSCSRRVRHACQHLATGRFLNSLDWDGKWKRTRSGFERSGMIAGRLFALSFKRPTGRVVLRGTSERRVRLDGDAASVKEGLKVELLDLLSEVMEQEYERSKV